MPTYNRIDPIALLERSDKWQLGAGRAAVFADVCLERPTILPHNSV